MMAQVPEDGSPGNSFLVFADRDQYGGSDNSETCMKSSAAAQDETSGASYHEEFASTSSQLREAAEEVTVQQQQQENININSSWTIQALLLDCARAIAEEDTPRIQSLLWSLNENSSPYGDSEQRIAACFVQALFCRVTGTGARCLHSLGAAAEKTFCFESMRNMILEFQEASPWTTFGHVAGNGALLEAMEGEARIHIVDITTTFCTQWPTFLEALATRADVETPHVRLTTIVISPEQAAMAVMQQVTSRLHRFARLMGVPFQSCVIQQPALADLDLAVLELREDEALAINCIQTLHHVDSELINVAAPSADHPQPPKHSIMSPRDTLLCTFRNAKPKMLIIVEDEANLVWPADHHNNFVGCFSEALRFYSLFFQSLDHSFPRASNHRLMLERTCARKLVNLLSCSDPSTSSDMISHLPERQETGVHWDARLRRAGFQPAPFSPDVVDDVQALLKRYKMGWGLDTVDNRLNLTWKEQAVICSTTWKLITTPSP